jgi:hypothetical protein
LITLPLWVLATAAPVLLPLAVTSLLLSLGVCAAAAGQAVLPRGKQRWWSRPMIASLFWLQPIVRGWARYQARLAPRPSPPQAQPNLDSVALRDSAGSLGEAAYWAEEPVDRLWVVREIARRLDQDGWPSRADGGWGDFDLEVYDARWCKVQLVTVAEPHPNKKTLVKLRLRSRWSMRAAAVFWSLLGAELAIIGLADQYQPWLWLLLLTIPALAWFFHRQKRNLQSMLLVFLDELAREWHFTKVRKERTFTDLKLPQKSQLRHSPFRPRLETDPASPETAPPPSGGGIPDRTPS